MQIGIFGASGGIGTRLVAEAIDRGHRVTAFTTDPAKIPESHPASVTWRVADPLDADSVADAIGDVDVVVLTIAAGRGVPDTIANAGNYVVAAHAMVKALERHLRKRVIVVGGAGSLEVAPGLQMVDEEGFAESLPEFIGTPPEYARAVEAGRDALDVYRTSNRLWTYLSPAGTTVPGERTGRFRLGTDQLLVDEKGESRISYEDVAVAIVDEIEVPRFVQRRFTLAY